MDVYVADAKRVWVRAKLKGRYAAGERVEALIDGRPKEVELPAEEMVVDDLLDVEDLCELGHVHEASVLETVERRFKASKPYTMAGDVVLAVNPYKWLDKLYTRDTRRAYEVGKPKDAHVYAISALAARGAARGEDQSVLVSGESGAGKTESVKLVLAHLADVAAHGSSTKTIVERVLRAGPLLESFGNAATSRNGNSSRFAKFLRVEFKKNTMEMAGSWCETALLEKTRVVSRATNERAFHVFYELLALRGDYASLYAESQFELLASDRAHVSAEKARGHNDSAGAKSMLSSLQDVCGLKEDDAAGKFLSCVAAVVALGRVSFREEDDDASSSKEADGGDPAAAISDEAALKDAATLIGCDSEGLKRGLLARDVRGHEVLLRVEAASSARDALAKALYSKIFDKVVDLSNEATAADATRKNEKQPPRGGGGAVIVGMLDLFGFEFYAASNHGFADKSRTNGLPQMLINLANERLQQRFVADVLAKAQQELVAEGVPWTKVEYDDNAEVLRLLEGRAGLVDILNEECIRGASGTDANFVDKLLAFHKTHAALSTPKIPVISKKTRALAFFVDHYAANVLYACDESWVDANRDVLPARLDAALLKGSASSSHQNTTLMTTPAQLYAWSFSQQQKKTKGPTTSKRRGAGALSTHETVASKFRSQLRDLMRDVAATQCRYVRCVRPNDAARPVGTPNCFDRIAVVEQLRCCGVLSALRVSRAGYPDRKGVRPFVERFAICAPKLKPSELLEKCRVPGSSYEDLQGESSPEDDDLVVTSAARSDDATYLDPAVVDECAPWRLASQKIVKAVDEAQRKTNSKKSNRGAPSTSTLGGVATRVFIGKTKVFLRDGALDELERIRANACFDSAAKIQAMARRAKERALYVRALAAVLLAQCGVRRKLAYFKFAELRRKLEACIAFQALVRGAQCREIGEYKIKKSAIRRIQTWYRPFLAKKRVDTVRGLKAKGLELDSIQSRLRDLSSKHLPGGSSATSKKAQQKKKFVGGFSSSGGGSSPSSSSLEEVRAEAAATVAAAKEVASDASKALEELRKENAALRERCAAAEARAEAYRNSQAKATQREAQLLAMVDEARREATDAHEKRKRAQTETAIAQHGSDATANYTRLRQQMLRATGIAPELRKKILATRRPNRSVTVTQNELKNFRDKLVSTGVDVLKHATSGRAQKRRLRLTDSGDALFWEKPSESIKRVKAPPPKKKGAKSDFYALAECQEVRPATDVDPDSARNRLQCGTKTLRKSMEAKHAPLAFSFIYPSRTIDVELYTLEDAKVTLRYFKALVQSARAKALKELLGDESENDSSYYPPSPSVSNFAGSPAGQTTHNGSMTDDTDSLVDSNTPSFSPLDNNNNGSHYSASV